MKKEYLTPDTLDLVLTAGCLQDIDPMKDPNITSSFLDSAPARRGGIAPAGL